MDKAKIVQHLTASLEEMQEINRKATSETWQGFHRAARRPYSYRIRQGKVDPEPVTKIDHSEAIKTLLLYEYNTASVFSSGERDTAFLPGREVIFTSFPPVTGSR